MTQLGRHMLTKCTAGVMTFCAAAFVCVGTAQAGEKSKSPTKSKVINTAPLPPVAPILGQTATGDFTLKTPSPSTRLLDLNLDMESVSCLAGEQSCLQSKAPLNMKFSKSISKKSKKGLDVELVPSASVHFDDDGQSAVVGAVVRIGEDLRAKDVASNTWYIFAGADAEALSYSPGSSKQLRQGQFGGQFGLNERIIIGDAQAGIGYRIGSADVSLGYVRREISTLNGTLGSEGFSKTEDAAALSFTWKR